MTISSYRAERASVLEDKIREVDEAIDKVLSGQSYSLGTRSVTRVDLDSLRSYRAELVNELSDLESGSDGHRKFRRAVPLG